MEYLLQQAPMVRLREPLKVIVFFGYLTTAVWFGLTAGAFFGGANLFPTMEYLIIWVYLLLSTSSGILSYNRLATYYKSVYGVVMITALCQSVEWVVYSCASVFVYQYYFTDYDNIIIITTALLLRYNALMSMSYVDQQFAILKQKNN